MLGVVAAVFAGARADRSQAGEQTPDAVQTKFAWSGTITTKEQMTISGRKAADGYCAGAVTSSVTSTIKIQSGAQVAREVRRGVWETRVQWSRSGKPSVSVGGTLGCALYPPADQKAVISVGGAAFHDGPGSFGALTVRFDSSAGKLEIVPEYGQAGAVFGSVTNQTHLDGTDSLFKGSETVLLVYGLPRLELHPAEERSGDFRAHVTQKRVNTVAMSAAGFSRALADLGGGGFGGSPITTFICCEGNVGSASLWTKPQYSERVTGTLQARVFGPDRDHDRVDDAVDPDPGRPDADGDGFPDYWELSRQTNPRDKQSHPGDRCCPGAPDSDGDGHSDPQEIAGHSDPNDPADVPNADTDGPVKTKPGGGGGDGKQAVVPPGCKKGLLYLECRVMLSVNRTQAMADHPNFAQPFTVAQLTNWCKSILTGGISPVSLGKCVGTPTLIAAESLSLSQGLRIATSPPRCFYYRAIKHRAPSLTDLGGWSASWSLSYNAADYLYDRGETTTFAGKTFTCTQQ